MSVPRNPSRGPWSVIGWSALVVLTLGVGWQAVFSSVDFPIYYQSGLQILRGDFDLYPAALYTGGTSVEGHGYRYAPGIALLFVPFALLPYHLAAASFFAMKVAAFVHTIAILSRRLNLRQERVALIWMVLAVSGGYLVEEFRGGNLQFVIVYLIVYAFDRAQRGQVISSGLALGLAIAAKLVPAVVAGYLLLRGRTLVVVCATAVVGLVAVAPALLWGADQNRHLLVGFRAYSATAVGTAANDRNYSFRGFLTSVTRTSGLDSRIATGSWLVLSGAVAAAVLFILLRGPRGLFGLEVELALIVCLIPLLSPHSQRIYFSYLAVPAAVVFGVLRAGQLDAITHKLAVAALVSATLLGTVLPLALASRSLSLAYMNLFPYTVAAVAMACSLAVIASREPSTAK